MMKRVRAEDMANSPEIGLQWRKKEAKKTEMKRDAETRSGQRGSLKRKKGHVSGFKWPGFCLLKK